MAAKISEYLGLNLSRTEKSVMVKNTGRGKAAPACNFCSRLSGRIIFPNCRGRCHFNDRSFAETGGNSDTVALAKNNFYAPVYIDEADMPVFGINLVTHAAV